MYDGDRMHRGDLLKSDVMSEAILVGAGALALVILIVLLLVVLTQTLASL